MFNSSLLDRVINALFVVIVIMAMLGAILAFGVICVGLIEMLLG